MTTTTPGPSALRGAVGTAHTRIEGRDKVTGAARYAGEIPYPELAHGWLVLSTVARGRILDVETGPVLAMPGVLTVLHHGNAPPPPHRLHRDARRPAGPDLRRLPGRPGAVHAGWPVALVVAETPEVAREAAEALVVTYEREPHDTELVAGHP